MLADRLVPDWSVLMVQFQNLDPFQHRVWPYLNVDETGIDRPEWNSAAAQVIRGLDDAIGRLCELAEKRGAARDDGQRPRLRALPGPHPRQSHPGQGRRRPAAGSGPARSSAGLARPATDCGSGARNATTRPLARPRSTSRSPPSIHSTGNAHSPSAPHQDTAAMVYVNCAARHGGVKTSAPRMSPRQIDEARTAAAAALAEAKHPDNGTRLFPQIIETADAYQIDPTREGYPDLIALPDEPYWVRTKLTSGLSWVEPDPNLPGTHRPEGIVALAGAGLEPGRYLKANLIDATPTILSLLGLAIPAHVEGKPIAGPATTPHVTAGFTATRHDAARTTPRRSSSEAVRIHLRRATDHRTAPGGPGLPGMSALLNEARLRSHPSRCPILLRPCCITGQRFSVLARSWRMDRTRGFGNRLAGNFYQLRAFPL